jgi:predicted Zn finger-like uncharacterized protein
MSMVTRCPQCNTTFRVTAAHLKAREGYVRCGRCSEVFNALATLAALTGENERNEPARELIVPQANEDEVDFLASEQRAELPWSLLTACAAVVLVVQMIYLYSADVASRFPATAPYFDALCTVLRCSLEPAYDPGDLEIIDSDLRADSAREETFLLSATLKNGSEDARPYPALEVTLTDEQNKAIARRVFMPHEYLGRKAGKIAPRAQAELELPLKLTDLNAAGYRLYLFYP